MPLETVAGLVAAVALGVTASSLVRPQTSRKSWLALALGCYPNLFWMLTAPLSLVLAVLLWQERGAATPR